MLITIYNLLKPFKRLVSILFFLIFFTAFLEAFGLALFLPILDIALNENSTSPLVKILDVPLKVLNINKNIVELGFVVIIMIIS